jgi:hypothetical protein
MRSGFEERRERGFLGLSRAVGRLDNQKLKGVGFLSASEISAKACRYQQNSKSLPAESNSSKRGLTIRGMFMPSGKPSRSCAQLASPEPECGK